MLIDPEGYIAHQVSGEGHVGLSHAGDHDAALGARGEGDARTRPAAGRAARAPAAHRPALPRQGRARPRAGPDRGRRHGTPPDRAARRGRHVARRDRHRRADAAGRLVRATPRCTARRASRSGAARSGSPTRATTVCAAPTSTARELQTVGGPLRSPWDVAPYADDILVIAMAGTHQLWGYDVNYDRTGLVAGTGREGLADGPAVQAELAQPSGLAPLGRLLGFVDAESSSLRVLAPAERGGVEVATVIGAGLFEWGDRDGSIGEARLQHPTGIASIAEGFIVSDTYNHRLRSVHMEAGTVTTIAGGEPGLPRRHRQRGALLRAGRQSRASATS